jgi:hypothetical protein
MSQEQIDKRVEQTLRRNRAAIKRANNRGQRLNRAAEQSAILLDRAFKQLRQESL